MGGGAVSANLRREWRLEAQKELEAACAVAYANGRRSGRWQGIWLTIVGLGLVAWVGRRVRS